MAGERGRGLFDRTVAAVLGQGAEGLLDRRGGAARWQLDRHGGDAQAPGPKLLVLEPQVGQLRTVVGRGGDRRGLEVDGLRDEQGLARAPSASQPLEEAVVEDALVRRVLVDQDQAVGAFGDQVARAGLADRSEQRRGCVPVGLRGRHRGRRVMQGQLGAGDRDRGGRDLRWPVAKRVAPIQGRANGALERGKHRAFIAKTDFLLRRVDVDVDQLGVDADVDDRDRMSPALEPSLVALLQGIDERPRADRPAVDREHHAVAAAPAEARLADHAGHERQPDHLQHLRRNRRPIYRRDRTPPVAVAVGADGGTAVDGEVNADVWMEQRKRADHVFDRGHLGRIALQKLEARRHVPKEIPHLDRDAGEQGPRPVLHDLCVADAERRAAGGALDVGDGRDACQRFAAKAERLDHGEIRQRGQLARRVPDERQRELISRDAGAVVADADRRLARATDVDADPACPGVERVLDQLLDHRGRALDHLASGDRVGDLRRQHLDHEVSFARSWYSFCSASRGLRDPGSISSSSLRRGSGDISIGSPS